MIINQIRFGSKNAIKLASIVITNLPNKTKYTVFETFNSEGMEVKAIFSNGASKMVTDFVVEPNILQISDTKVNVKYTELKVTAEAEVEIRVVPIKIDVPYTNNKSLVYTGSTLAPTWENYDSSLSYISGDTTATNVGFYTTTFTLKDKTNYAWTDGTITDKSVIWRINDAWPVVLKDFIYTENADNTATITDWKNTLNGVSSTEMVIPDNPGIIL